MIRRILTIVFPGFILSVLFTFSLHARVFEVTPEGKKIEEIIHEASPFDTINVRKGLYREAEVMVGKPLVIRGVPGAVFDGGGQKKEMFILSADSVILENLSIRNIGMSYMQDLAAVRAIKCRYGVIRNLKIKDVFFGIYLQGCGNFRVNGNHLTDEAKTQASSGNAIHLWKTDSTEVRNNFTSGFRDGIYFEFVSHSVITGNISQKNLRYGLHFMFSDHDEYRNNIFRENGAGVAVMFSERITMERNEFTRNVGGSSYGLLLKEINHGVIRHNRFERNTVGITAEGTNDVIIDQNIFEGNGKAINMMGNCLDNQINANNFFGNTFEVLTNTKYNQNSYLENYWSKYMGYDLDKDGFGDVPYRPLSVFSRIINQVPVAAILIRSFFVRLLDMAEKVIPTLISEELKDPRPKIKPYPYD